MSQKTLQHYIKVYVRFGWTCSDNLWKGEVGDKEGWGEQTIGGAGKWLEFELKKTLVINSYALDQ